jgi:tRNA pseudouridine32 synthase / 23S rRNA pseudouridine746 synthase
MIQIVFQNKNFIVCNKPAEVLSVPAREKNDPRPCLGIALQNEFETQIFPVHRLDFETSGLIMYALNAQSHKISQDWFLKKTIHKHYQAMTCFQNFNHWPANIETDRSVIEANVELTAHWRTQMQRGKRRSFESKHGEWAETEARMIEVRQGHILWQLDPITGKPHQLRFELSRRGFPILGDGLYGSRESFTGPGIALRAVRLNLLDIENRLGLPDSFDVEGFSIV